MSIEPKKIALVSAYDIAVPGGVNGHVTHLAHEFRDRGHAVRIIAPGPPEATHEPATITLGRTFPFPSGGSLARVTISPWLGSHVKNLLARERFDVVHIHEPLISSLTLLVLRHACALKVGTFHAAREGGKSRGYALTHLFLRPLSRRLDGCIAVSPAAARLASRYFPGPYEIIPNGVDVRRFATPLPCPSGIDGTQPYVLFVGRFEERKGLPVLLHAFALLKRRVPAVHLVIVGDGRSRGRHERWVEREAVADVHFAGRVPAADLPAYYQHAAVFCAPNTGHESFGLVLLEAMAAGCPVVASAIEGLSTVVTAGHNGLLVRPRDPGALADALERVLTDAPLARTLTAHGSGHAREFDWAHVATRVLGYYDALLNRTP
jgi:phosphatidylinositol alpha-mannosyltransferase